MRLLYPFENRTRNIEGISHNLGHAASRTERRRRTRRRAAEAPQTAGCGASRTEQIDAADYGSTGTILERRLALTKPKWLEPIFDGFGRVRFGFNAIGVVFGSASRNRFLKSQFNNYIHDR